MSAKTVGATQFKAECLKLIDAMNRDLQPVVITKRGLPVAKLIPFGPDDAKGSMIGALKGSVSKYDDPFSPAADPSDWTFNR